MAFRFLEHTADLRAECRADSFAGLLESAADALYAAALSRRHAAEAVERRIALQGDAPEELLVRWLQELIFLLDAERFVAARVHFDDLREGRLEARLHGYLCPATERDAEVKAATYHGMRVREDGGGWSVEVLFDL